MGDSGDQVTFAISFGTESFPRKMQEKLSFGISLLNNDLRTFQCQSARSYVIGGKMNNFKSNFVFKMLSTKALTVNSSLVLEVVNK